MRGGSLRHIVNIMRPTKALDDRGQLQGKDELFIKDWPCGINTLSGRKAESARTLVASATHEVTGYGNPAKPLKTSDYLTLGNRKFEVLFIDDKQQNGIELKLLCEEKVNA